MRLIFLLAFILFSIYVSGQTDKSPSTPFLAVSPTFTQSDSARAELLNQDPVFKKVLSRRISYPPFEVTIRRTKLVYAQFDIDTMGHIQDVIILNPSFDSRIGGRVDDFDVNVKKAIRKLPPLNPRYLGRYTLPVMFIIDDGQTGEILKPTNTIIGFSFGNLLLETIYIKGYYIYVNNPNKGVLKF
ncbi:hypothetical protein [Spirosoma foliorum]|uniref:TonB C-terminal domain-containing protein n=1 Tax=Spirosoma foliorum TaxID=2710596 RepID=A0A7G5GPP6_9BACT|nr:hypothetical protein [Spirosoma foliorum]QMW00838.1 hypothetical protein H3H32_23005 [Spirosoma foliorum]